MCNRKQIEKPVGPLPDSDDHRQDEDEGQEALATLQKLIGIPKESLPIHENKFESSISSSSRACLC
jgi:hypothetical protein